MRGAVATGAVISTACRKFAVRGEQFGGCAVDSVKLPKEIPPMEIVKRTAVVFAGMSLMAVPLAAMTGETARAGEGHADAVAEAEQNATVAVAVAAGIGLFLLFVEPDEPGNGP